MEKNDIDVLYVTKNNFLNLAARYSSIHPYSLAYGVIAKK